MRYALIVEYDGTLYSGFQYQNDAKSIQEEIETAIALFTGEAVRIKAAGRTDAGVHALGQVVAFDTDTSYPADVVVRALNSHLPNDIAVKSAGAVADDFDPRRRAVSRTYLYTIDCGRTRSPLRRRTSYHLGRRLAVDRMVEAAELLEGVHDFSQFAGRLERADASAVREVHSIEIRECGEIVHIEVIGNAFLPHQVRRMAGSLVDAGLGKMTTEHIRQLLEGRPSRVTARALPPHGLCLVRVQYEDSDTLLSEGN